MLVVGEGLGLDRAAPARSSGRDSASPARDGPRSRCRSPARRARPRHSATSVVMIALARAAVEAVRDELRRALPVDAGVGHDEADRPRTGRGGSARCRAGCPSRASARSTCSGPAPPKAQSVKSRGSSPRSISTERSAPTMLLSAMRTMASAVSSTRLAELSRRSAAIACARGLGVERHAAAEEVVRVDAAEHQVGVGDGRLGAAAAVAGRARAWRRRSAGRRAACRPCRSRRSSRRRRRWCGCRSSAPGSARPIRSRRRW